MQCESLTDVPEVAHLEREYLAEEAIELGVQLHRDGNLEAAFELYKEVLRLNERHPDALNLVGVVAAQLGEDQRALEWLRKAIQERPDIADYHNNLGHVLEQQGALEDAIKCYEKALLLDSDHVQAKENLYNAHRAKNVLYEIKPAMALDSSFEHINKKLKKFRQTKNKKKKHVQSYKLIDNALKLNQSGKVNEAEQLLRQVLANQSDNAEALYMLGGICLKTGQYQQALTFSRKAATLRPDIAHAHYLLGLSYIKLNRFWNAVDSLRQANETISESHSDSLIFLRELGVAVCLDGDSNEAARIFEKVLSISPGDVHACFNLGCLTSDLDKSIDLYRRAIAVQPDYYKAHWNLGLDLLRRGDAEEGWEKYEFGNLAGERKTLEIPVPAWQGDDLSSRHILVWKEQGIGDQIMFASCCPDIIRLAGHCTIETDPRLVGLFSRSFPQATVVAEPAYKRTDADTSVANPFDLQISIASLPRYLRNRITDFPEHQGYLIPDPEQVNFWQQRIHQLSKGLKVGICWRSGFINPRRSIHYTNLGEWESIFKVPGVEFINLQYGDCEAELLDAEKRFGIRIHRWSDLDLKDDLEGAAALSSVLDLVISAGTAVGEMAGALNVPVWRFSPGSDWTTLGIGRRPWFPAMQVFEKTNLEDTWEETMDRIAKTLQELGKDYV